MRILLKFMLTYNILFHCYRSLIRNLLEKYFQAPEDKRADIVKVIGGLLGMPHDQTRQVCLSQQFTILQFYNFLCNSHLNNIDVLTLSFNLITYSHQIFGQTLIKVSFLAVSAPKLMVIVD